MSTDGEVEPAQALPQLPGSIWVVAWASVASQVVQLLDRGGRHDDEVSLVGSVLLGALLVGYVSAGVVRARPVRVLVAWVILGLSAIVELVHLVALDDRRDAGLSVLEFAATAVTLGALWRFQHTSWYAWQRTRPHARDGVPIGALVAIGFLVGAMGGLIEPGNDGVRVEGTVNAAQR